MIQLWQLIALAKIGVAVWAFFVAMSLPEPLNLVVMIAAIIAIALA